MIPDSKPPAPKSALLDAQAKKARTELALQAHRELVSSTKAEWGVADALAMKSEGIRSREYRAAEELAKQLQWLERKTDDLVEEDRKAEEILKSARVATATAGASEVGKAVNGLDQQLLQALAADLARWAGALSKYGEHQAAWEQARADVEQLGGPAPRADFRLQVPSFIARSPASGRGLGPVDVAATLARGLTWVQRAPQRSAEEAAKCKAREVAGESARQQAALRGKLGEEERQRAREGLTAFNGRPLDGMTPRS